MQLVLDCLKIDYAHLHDLEIFILNLEFLLGVIITVCVTLDLTVAMIAKKCCYLLHGADESVCL